MRTLIETDSRGNRRPPLVYIDISTFSQWYKAHNGHSLVVTDLLYRLPGSVRLRPLLLFPLRQHLGDAAFQHFPFRPLAQSR
jgi:hypothetical protein